ncbi:SDR family oxidoreductase [Lactiplantibacillus carotarum]|uniref:SDR family oxidoreductase n=1 Tax=Lactiplantibacillus carotarum TaxID=2993456 RepID=UPI00298EF4D7|nr:SDR family oxidoreductase [Lactiplantibacillus carotarum]
MTVENKVIIITGASSGIGEATAKLLASKGAKVVLGARRTDKLQQIVQDIKDAGGEAAFQTLDVVNVMDNEKIVNFAKATYGSVDAIFLNAGIMPLAPMSELQVNEWDKMIDINLKGVLNGIAAVLPTFKDKKSGQIITTSSVAGLKVFPTAVVYSATKFAVKAVMDGIRNESATEGTHIRATTIYPGIINTELTKTIVDKEASAAEQALHEKIGLNASEVAQAVLYAVDQPEETNIDGITITPTLQAW